MRRRDEGRASDRRAADHFSRTQQFTRDGAEVAAGLARDDHAGRDVVSVFAQERGRREPIGGNERLFAAGTPQVAKPARQRSGINDTQRIGADADVVLIVEFRSVVSRKLVSVEPLCPVLSRPRTAP